MVSPVLFLTQRRKGAKKCRSSQSFAPLRLCVSLFWLSALCSPLSAEDYYRIETYDLPSGVNFEASGLAVTDKSKLAVALRKGEIWIEGEEGFQRFASNTRLICAIR